MKWNLTPPTSVICVSPSLHLYTAKYRTLQEFQLANLGLLCWPGFMSVSVSGITHFLLVKLPPDRFRLVLPRRQVRHDVRFLGFCRPRALLFRKGQARPRPRNGLAPLFRRPEPTIRPPSLSPNRFPRPPSLWRGNPFPAISSREPGSAPLRPSPGTDR